MSSRFNPNCSAWSKLYSKSYVWTKEEPWNGQAPNLTGRFSVFLTLNVKKCFDLSILRGYSRLLTFYFSFLTRYSWLVTFELSLLACHSWLNTLDFLLLTCYVWLVNLHLSLFALDLSVFACHFWLATLYMSLLFLDITLEMSHLTCHSWYITLDLLILTDNNPNIQFLKHPYSVLNTPIWNTLKVCFWASLKHP